MKIRRVEAGDEQRWLDAVARLVDPDDRDDRIATRAELRDALAEHGCYLYLALAGEEPVGLLSAHRFPDVEAGGHLVYLYDIEVASAQRRTGIGAALVEALVEQCERDGIRRIWAGTGRTNVAARRTFEKTSAELEGDDYVEYEWDLED